MPHAPFRLGEIDVVTVCEGWAPMALSDEAPGNTVDWPAERAEHPWAFADDDHWPWHVHAFLLRTRAGDVLVDSGVGTFGPYAPWAEEFGSRRLVGDRRRGGATRGADASARGSRGRNGLR